jgi:hypothetical protein
MNTAMVDIASVHDHSLCGAGDPTVIYINLTNLFIRHTSNFRQRKEQRLQKSMLLLMELAT